MKIVLNSDILLSLSFAGGTLPAKFAELCEICRERGIGIVLPETTLLEFDRRQLAIAEDTASQLAKALSLLKRFSIAHDDVAPQDIVKPPDLIALLTATGVTVEVVQPSCDELREAHRRACTHLPPTAEKKSDEMRDVVIWLVALATAHRSTGAVLIARDVLFHDLRVDEEAKAVGLIRMKAVEDAIDHVRGLRSAPERFAAMLVTAIREDLSAGGVPMPDDVNRYELSNLVFALEEEGSLARVEFRLVVEQEARQQFAAHMAIEVREGVVVGVSLTGIDSATVAMPNDAIALTTNRAVDLAEAAAAAGLRNVAAFGGQSESEDR